MTAATTPVGTDDQQVLDWTDLGREMWSFLTGRNAAINYSFVDMVVEVPRDTGPQAPRAIWRLNGTLRVTTSEDTVPSAGTREPAR
jgi:hypothetical protein